MGLLPKCETVSIGRWGRGPRAAGTAYPAGGRGYYEASGRSAPGPRRLRRGSPTFFEESRGKEHQGQAPGPRVLWPLVATRWFLRWLFLIRQRGYFFRYPKTDLGRIFRKKYDEKHFCERKFPNQGTYMGTETAPPPEQCGTTAKTSERQRAGHKKTGVQGALPPALFPPAFSGESRAPARSRAGTHLAGPTLWRARKAHKNTPRLASGGGLSHIVDGTRAAGSGLPLTQTQPVPGPCREPSPLQCSGGCCASTYGAPPQRGCPGSPAGRARR